MTLRERLGAELFRKVAGPNGEQARERVHGTPGARWFAPDSPIARVHGDASMFVGGIRAVMLQSLHPAAMQGVADHSGYRGDMWGRLAQVSTYIAMTTFGTERDALQVIRAVQRAHESVTGTMPDGTAYAANDPHLLGWVHVAEIDSFLAAHDRYGQQRLVGGERDTYVAQTAVAAEHLGVIGAPRTEAELRTALEAYAHELRATPEAREAISFLLLHPDLPLAARPGYLTLAAAAIGLLPTEARRELRLPPVPPLTNRVLGQLGTRTIRWAMSSGHERARALQQETAQA
ncbi:oxygenase MpaB family protein [Mycobacterium cookii]|uniref:Oxygenase MpaB family protein n=1 Tax=Nocardioides furvisabuli TaxID=375542 RepID=A0ABN2X5C4_9ACTN|nr:oxygenase MpaB family protein [Nocardioides furvisabuli]